MFLDEIRSGSDLSGDQTKNFSQLDLGIKPEFGFTAFTRHMRVHSRLLAREEVEPNPSSSENCETQMRPPCLRVNSR